jgi:hypothetical protein
MQPVVLRSLAGSCQFLIVRSLAGAGNSGFSSKRSFLTLNVAGIRPVANDQTDIHGIGPTKTGAPGHPHARRARLASQGLEVLGV